MKNVQKDLASDDDHLRKIITDDSKNVIKGFISVQNSTNKNYSEIISHPAFRGCSPRVVDQVFFLENYACDNKNKKSGNVNSSSLHTKSADNVKTVTTSSGPNKAQVGTSGTTTVIKQAAASVAPQYVPFTVTQKLLIALNVFLFLAIAIFAGCVIVIALIVSNDTD